MKETRIDRDAWFTEPDTVKDCMKIILDNIPNAMDHEWFEPSAGSGAFLLEAINQGIKATGIDIHPMHPSVKQADFLTQSREILNLSNKIVFGNPPYGVQGSIYSKFIKQSFNLGAKYVAFLLPAGSLTFKLMKYINHEIFYAEEVNTVFYTPQENKTYNKSPTPYFLVIYENKPLDSSRDKVLEEGKIDFNNADYVQGHDKIYFKKTTPEWNDFLQLDFFNLSYKNGFSIKTPNNNKFKFFKILDKQKFSQNYKFYLQLSSLSLNFIPSNETVNYWFKHHSKLKMIDSFKHTRLLKPGFEQTPISHYIQKSQETSRKLKTTKNNGSLETLENRTKTVQR